ncbi:phosphate ABC transporter permease subunit PstC [Granulosicoccaceae sp. 1_MG-2023]|nr:phosphate ABC transporter permease subunit PstC [Granulosicoccaceae sp. 1_MG-2023]
MNSGTLIVVIAVLAVIGYLTGRFRSVALSGNKTGGQVLHSRPAYYGYATAIWCGLPALLLLFLWTVFEPVLISGMVVRQLPAEMQSMSTGEQSLVLNDIRLLATQGGVGPGGTDMGDVAVYLQELQRTSSWIRNALVVVVALAGFAWGLSRIRPAFRARIFVESATKWLLFACSAVAVVTTLGIVLSVLFESIRFFGEVPPADFLLGTNWSPQTAIRSDQVGSSGAFGAIPLFVGTMLISAIAMLIAVPVGLMSAIYLSEYASKGFRSFAKPMLEILAGVPTVVYGFFAALTVAPLIRGWGQGLGLDVASESALAAGLVMGVMIIPFVSSISDDVISAVPRALREGALGMGATKNETIRQVVLPAALPGIVGGILLAVSRAIGETMIVVMAAGLAANLTINPLEAVTTVTVQIVTLLTGDQEFDSAKTLAAFALGLMLFVVTLLLNIAALHIVRKYREQYD